jgi:hypothetical protein
MVSNKAILPLVLLVLWVGSLPAMTLHKAATAVPDSGFSSPQVAIQEQIVEAPSQVEAPKTAAKADKWQMFNPNNLQNSPHFWVDAEALFWQANVGSLDYGVTSHSTTQVTHGRVKHPHFDWDFGGRLGLGYILPHDKWDLFANYTYVHGRAHGHAGGSDEVVFPSWASNFNGTNPFFANSAKAHWSMNLNMGDLELGRTCAVSKWLTIRPFVGVRGLVIDQAYRVVYSGGTVAPSDEDSVHLDTDFWGVGIRFGANTLWGLGRGFSIYGNGSGSLLSGHFDVKEKEKLKIADLHILNAKRDVDNVAATADLGLGIQWDCLFSRNRCHFGVKFGWELDLFFEQNQLFNFIGSSPASFKTQNDDLTFQGLTLGMRFDF